MLTLFQNLPRKFAARLFALTPWLALAGLPAWASLVIQTNTTSPILITDSVFENVSGGVQILHITIGNDNVPNLAITTGVLRVDPPVAASGDTGFDLVTGAGDTGVCDNKNLLPSNTPFTTAGSNCTFGLVLDIGDADTTDKIKPVDDVGEWFINIHIPWTRADGAIAETLMTVDERVQDDNVPEPGTWRLAASGVGLILICQVIRRTK